MIKGPVFQKNHSNIHYLETIFLHDCHFQTSYLNLTSKSQDFRQLTIQRVTRFYTLKYPLFQLHYASPVIFINHSVFYVSSQKRAINYCRNNPMDDTIRMMASDIFKKLLPWSLC